MMERKVWFLLLEEDGIVGIGECAPLPGLSRDDLQGLALHFRKLESDPGHFISPGSGLKDFPSLAFALEMAVQDLRKGGQRLLYPSPFTRQILPLSINGLIWMDSYQVMLGQIEEKLEEGWRCLKLKIGALDFNLELALLKRIRTRFGPDELELRVDANGAFSRSGVWKYLDQLGQLGLHSIEQPIPPGDWDFLAEICRDSPIPIALDEELIACHEEEQQILLLDQVHPQYLVLKPTLLGGFKRCDGWIAKAEERGIGWWVTSALESNLGLNAIAQWTATKEISSFQGLGTGQLYSNNFPSPLQMKQGELWFNKDGSWNLSGLGL
jgi:o-succinylbenzoate synthase